MPTAILLGLGCASGWGVANYVAGIQSRRLPAFSVVFASEMATTPALFALLLILRAPISAEGVLWGVLAGTFGVLSLTAFYRAMGLGQVSVVAPISAVGAVVPVVFDLVRGTIPSVLDGVGITVALAGVVLVSRQPSKPSDDTSSPARWEDREREEDVPPAVAPGVVERIAGVGRSGRDDVRTAAVLATASALGFGFFFVVTDIGTSSGGSPIWVVGGVRLGSLVTLAALALARPGRLVWPGRQLPVILAMGTADTTATVLFALSTTRGDIGPVSVIASLYPVVTVLLAWVGLDERLDAHQAAGAALALIGVVLLGVG
jgi:drug/metabolite transporter (DMT)-like permease